MFHVKHRRYDVIVVGGGHAGTEAALAASRLGAQTALVTHSFSRIGEMSCNPAIGGIGKGHIVREIDALDGVMGRAADKAGIQFRLLNRKKGPATQGPRTQADRNLYKSAIQAYLSHQENLSVIEGEVTDIDVKNGKISGLYVKEEYLQARAIVLTTGTFLRGMIHIGDEKKPAGRIGDPASQSLAKSIAELGLPLGRLKTGTPPRLRGGSIDWSRLTVQKADSDPELFSFLSDRPIAPQIFCGITHTNERTADIVQRNIRKSALYGGFIEGVGPRYCPSIEDKFVKFPEKSSHQVFLEPETLDCSVIYPNGISTSLPRGVQEEFVRSIHGLEKAEILQFGYAIEYDYVDPRALDRSLMVKNCRGLFLAGQINGTTGYEEAAGQGLIAGLSAAMYIREADPVILGRSDAYIGVMIDDLVTQGVSEPYRMFTSRAEYRLRLRADNADQRLTPIGLRLGCVSDQRKWTFERKMSRLTSGRLACDAVSLTPAEALGYGLHVNQDGTRRTLTELLASNFESLCQIKDQFPALAEVDDGTLVQIYRDAHYEPYIQREQRDVEALQRDELLSIPQDLDFATMSGLTNELRNKLERIRPATLAQARRIEGMTPAALTLILLRSKQAIGLRRSA